MRIRCPALLVSIILALPGIVGVLILANRVADYGDTRLYYEYAGMALGRPSCPDFANWVHDHVGAMPTTAVPLAHRLAPYRDFTCEYPPAALYECLLPRLLTSDLSTYIWMFQVMNAAMIVGTGVVLLLLYVPDPSEDVSGMRWDLRYRWAVVAGLWSAFVWLAGGFVVGRLDTAAAFFATLGMLAWLRRSPLAAGGLFAVGVAVKLWPLAVAASVIAYAVGRREHRLAGRMTVGIAVGLLVCHLPVVIVSGTAYCFGYLQFFRDRGLHIESVPGSVAVLVAKLAGEHPSSYWGYGTTLVRGGAWDLLIAEVGSLFMIALLLCVIGLSWAAGRRRCPASVDSVSAIAAGWVGVVCAFMLGSKVFSGQFLIWLFPAIFLLRGRAGGIGIVIFAITCVLTKAYYARFQAVLALEPLGVGLVASRNLMVFSLLVVAVCSLLAAARSLPKEQVRSEKGQCCD